MTTRLKSVKFKTTFTKIDFAENAKLRIEAETVLGVKMKTPYLKTFKQIKKRMNELNNDKHPLEVIFEKLVKKHNFKYTRFAKNKPLLNQYFADFYDPLYKVVIECDGHHHETVKGKAHDKTRDKFLEAAGYKVLRLKSGSIKSWYKQIIAFYYSNNIPLRRVNRDIILRKQGVKEPVKPSPAPKPKKVKKNIVKRHYIAGKKGKEVVVRKKKKNPRPKTWAKKMVATTKMNKLCSLHH